MKIKKKRLRVLDGEKIWRAILSSQQASKYRSKFKWEIYDLLGIKVEFANLEDFQNWEHQQSSETLLQFYKIFKHYIRKFADDFWFIKIQPNYDSIRAFLLLKKTPKFLERKIIHIPIRASAQMSSLRVELSPFARFEDLREFIDDQATKKDFIRIQSQVLSHYGLTYYEDIRGGIYAERNKLIRQLWKSPIDDLVEICQVDDDILIMSRRRDELISRIMEQLGYKVSSDHVRKIAGTKVL